MPKSLPILLGLWLSLSLLAGLYARYNGQSGIRFFCISMMSTPIVGWMLTMAICHTEYSSEDIEDEPAFPLPTTGNQNANTHPNP
ncbi:hypothetical protein [Ferrimonas marina]|uniref:Uncharacterized protein n=1 Tax=Ferrimonas marina TaxID=299255 RepID=A0A1M5N4X4_9GAMM|nr:hypothetical protein [Ferrimonas marina]SHG84561.1 hypothetical protein SAMN02745129_0896 [Ferrimonas marina]